MPFIRKFAPYLMVVVFAHLIGLGKSIKLSESGSVSRSKEVKSIKLKFKTPEAVAQQDSKQIATSVKIDNNDIPQKNAYLSEKNQTVSRQTQSRVVDRFNEGGGSAIQNMPTSTPMTGKKISKKIENLKLSEMAKLATMEPQQVKQAIAQQQKVAEMGTAGKGRGIASNNDYLEEVTLGDMTVLNTVEFKHYGFYQRIKQKLEQFWGATLREKAQKIYAQGRKLASINYITSLSIIMDHQGNIVDVKIKSASGVSELDDAAIESFNKAGPFPNPPKDLISNGFATIEWGFVVKS